MNLPNIYQRAPLNSKCYLIEAVYWLAFGRPPLEAFDDRGDPWRYSDARDGIDAPFPHDGIIERGETQFAGLPTDPRLLAIEAGNTHITPKHLAETIYSIERHSPDHPQIELMREQILESIDFHNNLDVWLSQLNDYLDPIQTEILHDLQRGHLKMFGHKLPYDIFDEEGPLPEEDWEKLNSSVAVPIPPRSWVSRNVKWEMSALRGEECSYIWIEVDTGELFRCYPPERVLKSESFEQLGQVFLVDAANPTYAEPSRRGRKPYPWGPFHVEVTKLYLAGGMPGKKEAAIEHFRNWFKEARGLDVSRSSIGEKLKLYFDIIGKTETH